MWAGPEWTSTSSGTWTSHFWDDNERSGLCRRSVDLCRGVPFSLRNVQVPRFWTRSRVSGDTGHSGRFPPGPRRRTSPPTPVSAHRDRVPELCLLLCVVQGPGVGPERDVE